MGTFTSAVVSKRFCDIW